MTPGQYLAAAKDALIIIGVLLLGWWIYHTGANANKVQDMSAVAKQIAQNETTQAQWRQRAEDASKQMAAEMAAIHARIDSQRAPVVLRGPSNSCPVPSPSSSTPSGPSPTGTAYAGLGADTDLRPQINEFEETYERVISECRAAITSWPR